MKKTILLLCCILAISLSACEKKNALELDKIGNQVSEGVQYLGDKTTEFIDTNTGAQKIISGAQQIFEEGKNTAIEALDGLKNEANNQYQSLKEDTKENLKSSLNEKIDTTFDKI